MKQHKITWASVKEHPQGAIEFLVESNRIEGIGDEGSALRYAGLISLGYQSICAQWKVTGPEPSSKILSKHEFNSMRALKFVVKHCHEDLTIEKILKLHALQMDGTMPIPRGKKRRFKAGVFREQPVYVNQKEKPDHRRIPTLVDEFLREFNDEERYAVVVGTALRTHYHFECIHPFIDGNGRVGRLLWLWDALQHRGSIHPILAHYTKEWNPCFNTKRKNYYDAIGEYEREEGWVEEEIHRYTHEELLLIKESSTFG